MCFHIHKNHRLPKTATRDITCYKVMLQKRNGKVFSFVTDFEYVCDRKYETEMRVVTGTGYNYGEIENGFHSFMYPWYKLRNKYVYARRVTGEATLVKCVIPKGSIYYKNPYDGEFVSNSIIVKELDALKNWRWLFS